MRGLYTRNGIFWARFKVRGIEYRESLRTRSESVAERRLKAAKQAVEDRVYFGASEPVSWQAAVVAWNGAIARLGLKPRTADRYISSIATLAPWLEDVDVQKIDHALLKKIVSERSKHGATNATIRRDITAVSSVLGVCVDENWIEENPARTLDRGRFKEKKATIILPREDSIAQVLAVGSRFIEMAAFARQTGMREEEVAGLTHDRIDRGRMAAVLEDTKGNRTRQVPLSAAALEIADRQPRHFKTRFVFWRGNGERFQNVPAQFYATVKRVARNAAQASAEFDRFRFHDLRHLYAVEFLRDRRGTLYELQQILGHVSVKTTEGYLDCLTPDEKRDAIHGVAQTAAQNQRFAEGNGGENG